MNQRHDEQKQTKRMYQNLYQARTNIVKDEEGDLVAGIYIILSMWRNNFSQQLNVHGVKVVRNLELHTAEPRMPEPSAFEDEMTIEKSKRHKSPDADQIPAELNKAERRQIRSEIHKLNNSIWFTEGLPEELKESITVPIYKSGNETDCSTYRYIPLLSTTCKILSTQPAVKVNSICRGNYWGLSMWISTQQVNY